MTKGYNSREMRRHPERFGLAKNTFGTTQPERLLPLVSNLAQEELMEYAKLQSIEDLRTKFQRYSNVEDSLKGELSSANFLMLVEQLYARYFSGQSLRDVVWHLGLIERITGKIQQSIIGGDADERALFGSNLLVGLVTRFVNAKRFLMDDLSEVSALSVEFSEKKNLQRLHRIIMLLEASMADVLRAQIFAKDTDMRLKDHHFNVEKEKEQYRAQANDLICGMKELRRYSIASSLYEDGLSSGDGEGWIVMDPVPFRHMSMVLRKSFEHSLAVFCLTAKSKKVKQITASSWRDTTSNIHFERINFSFQYEFRWDLADDGELYLRMYPAKIPLKDICARMGCEGVYEFLRFLFIAHLFDMVVPVEVSEQTPSLHRLRERIQREQQETRESPDAIIRKIVLPRKLIVRDTEKLQKAIDDSSEESHAEVERRLGRKIEHRIGSPVRLREGYRRHPQAVEWASEYGVTLKDNETWRQPVDPEKPLQKIVYSSKKDLKNTFHESDLSSGRTRRE